jgi:hypothetical protein
MLPDGASGLANALPVQVFSDRQVTKKTWVTGQSTAREENIFAAHRGAE